MVRKALWSTLIALVCLSFFVMSVLAQDESTPNGEAAPAITVVPNLAAANVVQTVPVTLTLSIPGPTGPMTIEVPIFLSLNIHIGISPNMTTSLAVTPSVATGEGVPPSVTLISPSGTPEGNGNAGTPAGEITPTSTVENTPESLEPTATEAPTATPTPAAPTATPLPAETSATAEVALPTATPTSAATATPEVVAPACPDPRAVIVSPGVGQVVSGNVNVLGTAIHERFDYYKIEDAPGADVSPDGDFAFLVNGKTPVTGGLLATFDSTILPNGPYTLKLTVVDTDGNFPPPCTVSVEVKN
jgi:hypothetical protein